MSLVATQSRVLAMFEQNSKELASFKNLLRSWLNGEGGVRYGDGVNYSKLLQRISQFGVYPII